MLSFDYCLRLKGSFFLKKGSEVDFHKYVKPAIYVFLSGIGLWIGSSILTYFTYNAEPEVGIVGVVSNGAYKGVIECALKGDSGYKVASVKLTLDGDPFIVEGARFVRSKKFDLPFELDTTELSDGKHILEIEAVDASYKSNKSFQEVEFYVDNLPLKATFLQPEYQVDQGRTLHPKIQLNKEVAFAKVSLFSNTYECYPESDASTIYESFIPVDCEQNSGEYLIHLEVKDRVDNVVKLSSTLNVKKINFPRQKGFYVAPEKLNDEKEVSMNNRILGEALDKWLEKSPKKKLWKGAFEIPTIVKRYSTPYGEIRVTPEKGRYLHRAVDIVNTPKSVVWASQKGRVIIKDRYLMTGNTIVIDHGLGIFTKYFHLDDFADVEVGDEIKKGEPVGRLGMTGYANGYHLHWELTVNGVAVDPLEWTKKVF